MEGDYRMKLKHLLYISLGMAISLFTACTDNEFAESGTHYIEEGIPVSVDLKYGVEESRQATRSAQDATVEQTVNRLFAIAFYADGCISGYRAYDAVNNAEGQGTINDFPMHSGANQQIFIVANPGTGMGTLTMDQLVAFAVGNGTLDDFKQLYSAFNDTDNIGTNVERMSFLMFGQMVNQSGTSAMNVETDGTISNYSKAVELERVDARITFKIKVQSDASHQDMTFIPRYYQVNNIPAGTYLYPQENDYVDAGYQNMKDETVSITKNFDGTETDNMYFEFYLLENRLQPTQTLSMSMIESGGQYWDNSSSMPTVQNLYALREKRQAINEGQNFDKPGQEYELGDYIYAPKNGAYVIFSGTLTYRNENNDMVYANTSYTVHLGSTGNSIDNGSTWYNEEDLVNNYDTERNTHYTYTVTLTGVNSIQVEVEDDREKRPGVEGDVVVAQGEVEDLDAHYGRVLFTLTRGEILAGLSWAIRTPFQQGIKVFNRENYLVDGNIPADESSLADREALKTGISLNDYKWVQFVINAEANRNRNWNEGISAGVVPDDEFAKYPGHEAYDGGTEQTAAPAFGGNGYHYEGSGWSNNGYYSEDVVMYDVNQLLNHLYMEANKSDSEIFHLNGRQSPSDDASVAITAFIDEYVYIYDPTQVFYRPPMSEDVPENDLVSLWKKVVNGENRLLHICKEGAEYSPDGNSSWANSVMTFSQRPIYTFYNPNASGITTAWGTESKNETGKLEVGAPSLSSQHSNTMDNGRENTLNIIPSGWSDELKWSAVLNRDGDAFGKLQSGYNNIWYACLGRNRDLNGDDIVQEDEIRWYLASIDQLTDLWIGEEAVPNAKLYDESLYVSGNRIERSHVASSSYYNGAASNPWVIWAEEGASRGDKNASQGSNGSGSKYDYRCVRNLGIGLENIDESPEDYATVSTSSWNGRYQEQIIEVSDLSSEARRAYTSGYLPANSERSYNNRPYQKFAVIINNLYPTSGATTRWNVYYENEEEYTPCPAGYRIPNQRELMLLYTRIPSLFNSDTDYMTKTEFSFKDYAPYTTEADQHGERIGFSYAGGNLYLISSKAKNNYGQLVDNIPVVRVRCVRDVAGN